MADGGCDRLKPHIVDYVVGEMDEAHARELGIPQHLEQCPACRAISEAMRGTGRALDAVASMDEGLDDESRRRITGMAHVEAELVRSTRGHQRISGAATAAGRVPAVAWLTLLAGALAAVAASWGASASLARRESPAGSVVQSVGADLETLWPAGRAVPAGHRISVPAGGLLRLKLEDGSRLDISGPGEICTASQREPMALAHGQMYLEPGSRISVGLAQLRALEIEAGAKVVFVVGPPEQASLLVSVIAGGADFSAAGGAGHVAAGRSLEVAHGAETPSVREFRETDRPVWLRKLDLQ